MGPARRGGKALRDPWACTGGPAEPVGTSSGAGRGRARSSALLGMGRALSGEAGGTFPEAGPQRTSPGPGKRGASAAPTPRPPREPSLDSCKGIVTHLGPDPSFTHQKGRGTEHGPTSVASSGTRALTPTVTSSPPPPPPPEFVWNSGERRGKALGESSIAPPLPSPPARKSHNSSLPQAQRCAHGHARPEPPSRVHTHSSAPSAPAFSLGAAGRFINIISI